MAATTPPAKDGSDFTYFDYFAAIGADIGRLVSLAWRERVVFFAVLAVCFIVGLYMAVFGRPLYRAETLLIARTTDNSGGLSRVLSGGSISSLTGLGGNKAGEELIIALKARNLIYPFVTRYGLDKALFPGLWDAEAQRWRAVSPGLSVRLVNTVTGRPSPPVQFGPTPEMAYDAVLKRMSVSQDTKSDVIHLSLDWTDPNQAAQWVNSLVTMLNDSRRQSTITTSHLRIRSLQAQLATTSSVEVRLALIELIQTDEEQIVAAQSERQFALRVIDPAVPLTDPIWPKRNLILTLSLVLGAVAGFVLALTWALLRNDGILQRMGWFGWRSAIQTRAAMDL